MINIITIVLFFIYLWGLGFTATYLVKKPEHFWERQFLNLGIGLGIFPILAILLNFLHIPLDWKIFLLLSMAFPVYRIARLIQKKTKPNFSALLKFTKSDLAILTVLAIVLASLYMYTSGAFNYPYLEDEDPWGHAVGAKYVSVEKNAYDPVLEGGNKIDPALSYIDPYPPAYDILMGIMHQTSPDLNWTLKFFNALLISLGFLFFYLFAKGFIDNRNKALLATIIFALIPAYLSHFIWAHSLVITIFFPLLYALQQIKEDKKWMYIALIITASVWVSQNIEQPLKLSTMVLLYLIVVSIINRKFFTQGFIALGGGIALSFLWWGVMIYKYTLGGFIDYFGSNVVNEEGASVLVAGKEFAASSGGLINHLTSILKTLTNPGGSASRAYTFSDFFFAQANNQINNPIGIGIVASLVVLFAVGYILWKHKSALVEEKNTWLCVSLLWLVFTFWGVNGMTFPVSVAKGAFRVWMLLAIPVALIATEGVYSAAALAKKFKIPAIAIFSLLIVGMVLTSGYQKYQLNTAVWPTSGAFSGGHPAEPFEYGLWFRSIPANTPVFLYTPRDKVVIGFGGYSCDWCQDLKDFRANILHTDAKQLHSFLKREGYQYLIINPRMDAKYLAGPFGEDETESLLPQRYNEIINSGSLFTPVYQKENLFLVFKVN